MSYDKPYDDSEVTVRDLHILSNKVALLMAGVIGVAIVDTALVLLVLGEDILAHTLATISCAFLVMILAFSYDGRVRAIVSRFYTFEEPPVSEQKFGVQKDLQSRGDD